MIFNGNNEKYQSLLTGEFPIGKIFSLLMTSILDSYHVHNKKIINIKIK